jgi:hypothetical protein
MYTTTETSLTKDDALLVLSHNAFKDCFNVSAQIGKYFFILSVKGYVNLNMEISKI